MANKPQRIFPNLKTYFEESDDTQMAFAARLNRSQSWVSRVVNGETEPSIEEALLISRMANVPLESLSVRPAAVSATEIVASDNE